MTKKKAALTSDLLIQKPDIVSGIPQRSLDDQRLKEMVGMNFTVSKEFRKDFKSWCLQNDLTMIEALEKALKLLKESS